MIMIIVSIRTADSAKALLHDAQDFFFFFHACAMPPIVTWFF